LKLTLFGLTISSSWGNGHATPYRALLRALHRRGHRVVFYEKDVDYYARRRDFSSCDYCELVLYSDWEQVRLRALADAASSDVVLCASYCPGGARINDEVLELTRPLRVFYDLDTPITLDGLARGPLDYLRADQIPAFDLYLSFTGGGILDELERRWGARRARPLYGCVDPEVHARVPARPEYQCALSYMGTYAADRQQQLEALFLEPARRRPQAPFVLAGSMYPRDWSWPANVRRFEHLAPGEHPAFYSSSGLTLNLTREGMARFGYCPSGRFFEAAACGTPIVTDRWAGLGTFFSPGEEIFLADRTEAVLDALATPAGALTRMAARARRRTLDEHTGDHRARELLAYCEDARCTRQIYHGDTEARRKADHVNSSVSPCLRGGLSQEPAS
jgi:spore maturation protein CgeB